MTDISELNPRSVRVVETVLHAAATLLIEGGVSEVTPTRLASETGVARTTIYRHWPDQASLVLATIESFIAPHHPTVVEGDLAADLKKSLLQLRKRLSVRPVREVFGALTCSGTGKESFDEARQRFIEGLVQPTLDVLMSYEEDGGFPGNRDAKLLTTTLVGPILFQHLVMGRPITNALIDEVVSQVTKTLD